MFILSERKNRLCRQKIQMILLTELNCDIDKNKFEKLYDEYYFYVYKIAFNIIGDRNYTDDAVQDIFIKVWQTMDTITDKNSAKAWIAVIARNVSVNILNKKKLTDKNNIDFDSAVVYKDNSLQSGNPSEITVDDDSVNFIYNSIKEMDKRYSEILLFKYKFHYSAEQIAELLDLNVKTVYTRIDRGRKILKDRLLLMKGGVGDE